MKEVDFYSVFVIEYDNVYNTKSVKSSFFKKLREARSYYRISVKFYDGIVMNDDLGSVSVRLEKNYKDSEYELIDRWIRDF